MDALILGAGYATRLYPLTQDRPKPLLPVGGIPLLQRICEQLCDAGAFEKIHVVTNHRFADHYQQWLHRQTPVYGHVLEGEWYDIGDLDSYRRADEVMKRKEAS